MTSYQVLMRKLLILLCLICPAAASIAAETIYYPRPESDTDARVIYPLKLLALALGKANAPYHLLPSPQRMQQDRAFKELESDKIHIAWSATSLEREEKTLPIRIPIYKGLIGWRLALVRKVDIHRFKDVTNLEQLKQFSAGQGHDWPDTQILRANGVKVIGSPTYDGLFKMLELKRFDYFPRSIAEIKAEADQNPELAIDPHIMLHYPMAFYYFVNKNNQKLANAINQGLEIAIADGSFDQLFAQYYRATMAQAKLEKRTVIELTNPLLPPETPLGREPLWFTFQK
jgi:ABC-type amino acid transport substrate-binding protein